MKMTFQPKKRQRAKVHGFRARMKTAGGRKVIAARSVFEGERADSKEFRMKRFPSIKKNSEFQHIYRSGASYANRLLVMYIERNGEDGNRIGISVSKKVGNSIVRHHITRLLREIFRLNNERIETGLNIVLVARGAAKESDYRHLEGAYMHLCGLHHILKESK